MRRLIFKLIAALVLVLLVEAVFQAGIWEPIAKPASHAGASIRLKRALSDPSVAHIDFVTLGSSRPEYGLDHHMIAAIAQKHGFVHADLSLPGSHWMTVGVLTRWLSRKHPEVSGGIIALSIQDMAYAGNGSYELGIVYPFHRLADTPWMAAHVPLKRDDPETWGVYSALFAWRQDIRDFVAHPQQRLKSLEWYATNKPTSDLFGNPESHGDMCRFGVDSMAACDQVEASDSGAAKKLRDQCQVIRGYAAGRSGFQSLLEKSPTAEQLRQAKRLVQDQLLEAPWREPPLMVLMPMPRIWTADALAKGLHAWSLSVLKPLADAKQIYLIDATGFFDADTDGGCSSFFDFYHENPVGRERFTGWLIPQIENTLYAPKDRGHEP